MKRRLLKSVRPLALPEARILLRMKAISGILWRNWMARQIPADSARFVVFALSGRER